MNKRWYRAFALAMAVAWLTAAGMARGQENKPAESAEAKEPPASQWDKINETPFYR
jgi:lipopolysaccharide export system protein LptC